VDADLQKTKSSAAYVFKEFAESHSFEWIHPCVINHVVFEALGCKSEGCGLETRCGELIFFPFYLILPAALGHGVYSVSNINEHQKQKKEVSGE
jgi:hypothetical protein